MIILNVLLTEHYRLLQLQRRAIEQGITIPPEESTPEPMRAEPLDAFTKGVVIGILLLVVVMTAWALVDVAMTQS